MNVEEDIALPRARARRTGTRPERASSRRLFDLLLVAFGAIVCGSSLLVLLPAPTSALWITAIIVTEWGHFVAVFCLLLAIAITQRSGVPARCAGALLIVSAIVCVVPATRAMIVARTLPSRSAAAFGEASSQTIGAPFSILDVFRGVPTGPVTVTEYVYATAGSKKLKLDVYRSPADQIAQPLVLVIHGGSWHGGNKRELPELDRYLASHGCTVAAMNYRHAPTWQSPAAVEDVFRAIDFLKANAAGLNIDANQIALIGRSAGGQIALSAAYANRDPAIRGVVSFYAPTDLALAYAEPSAPGVLDSCRVLERYLGGTPAQVPDAYANASPTNFVEETTPPTLLIHGGLDPIVSPIHSELLAARLQEAARPFLYLYLPSATHGCDANLSGPSGQLSLYAIERFFGAIFPPGERPNG